MAGLPWSLAPRSSHSLMRMNLLGLSPHQSLMMSPLTRLITFVLTNQTVKALQTPKLQPLLASAEPPVVTVLEPDSPRLLCVILYIKLLCVINCNITSYCV